MGRTDLRVEPPGDARQLRARRVRAVGSVSCQSQREPGAAQLTSAVFRRNQRLAMRARSPADGARIAVERAAVIVAARHLNEHALWVIELQIRVPSPAVQAAGAVDSACVLGACADADQLDIGRSSARLLVVIAAPALGDRKSTRLNSSHVEISYAVFCLKKKKINIKICYLYFYSFRQKLRQSMQLLNKF